MSGDQVEIREEQCRELLETLDAIGSALAVLQIIASVSTGLIVGLLLIIAVSV